MMCTSDDVEVDK